MLTSPGILVGRGIEDFTLLCEDLIDSAEIEGTYDRAGHLHDDLEQTETHLTSEINANETLLSNLASSLSAHDVHIDRDLAAHDANLSNRADVIDETLALQAEFLIAFREEKAAAHRLASRLGGLRPRGRRHLQV